MTTTANQKVRIQSRVCYVDIQGMCACHNKQVSKLITILSYYKKLLLLLF